MQEAKQSATNNGSKQESTAPKKTGIKLLMSKYGYSALGVYIAISFIDLPLSFLLVHSMGQDRIVELENTVKGVFGFSTDLEDSPIVASLEKSEGSHIEMGKDGHVVTTMEAVAAPKEEEKEGWRAYISPTLLTEFGIAYALHKSLIFVRVPLTAAITPTIVKTLQRWGFKIGKKVAAVGATATAASK